MQEDPQTQVVHIVECPEGPVCPAVVRVAGLQGETAIVGRIVTDPAIARALGKHIGPGEAALIVPDELLDMIRKEVL